MGEARRRATAGVWGGSLLGEAGAEMDVPAPSRVASHRSSARGGGPACLSSSWCTGACQQVSVVGGAVWLCDRGGSTGHCRVAPGWDAV